jgi:hypothetical protein
VPIRPPAPRGFEPRVIQGGKGVNPAPNSSPKAPSALGDSLDPMDREKLNRAIEAGNRLPEARSGAGEALENAIRKSDPITPATPVKPISTPATTPTPAEIPELPDPFAPGKLWGKPTPAKEEKPTPGRTNTPPKNNPGVKKEVPTKAKPFDNGQFHTPLPRPADADKWEKVPPGTVFGDPPAKKKSPTKKNTPAKTPSTENQPTRPTIQDRPGDAPRPMTDKEINMVRNGPSQTPTTPPATNPTPDQNPTPTPGGRRQETKKEAVERKYAGRSINGLTEAEKKEIREGGYTLSPKPKSGPPTIRRTNSASGESGLHMENVGGVWTIQKGPAPANNRFPSSPYKMKKNILEGTGVKEVPKDYQAHHGITVETWNSKELTKLAQKYGVAGGVDAQDGMVLAPSTLEAKNRTGGDVDKLEQQGKLIRILHPGSHPKFTKFGDKLIDKEEERLKEKYDVDNLEQIPADKLPGELDNSIREIRKKINDVLKDADKEIKAGRYNGLPKEIKDFIEQDPKRQNQYKISDRPTGLDIARFRNALEGVTTKARELNTYNISGVPNATILSSLGSGTQQSYAQMLALSVAAAKGGDPATKSSLFTAQNKGATIDIYSNGSKLASIDRKAKTITIERPMTASEKQNLSKQGAEMQSNIQAQAQAQAQAQKAQNIASTRNSLQRGM